MKSILTILLLIPIFLNAQCIEELLSKGDHSDFISFDGFSMVIYKDHFVLMTEKGNDCIDTGNGTLMQFNDGSDLFLKNTNPFNCDGLASYDIVGSLLKLSTHRINKIAFGFKSGSKVSDVSDLLGLKLMMNFICIYNESE